MEQAGMLHQLIDLSTVHEAIANVQETIDEHFVWLDEILTECKSTFSTATIDLLPKTPSQKKPRKRVKKRITEHLETVSESENITDIPPDQPVGSTSETPVRRLRSTRSRAAQSSTSTKSTRSSRTASRKQEDKENTVLEVKENHGVTFKALLPSVSEYTEQNVALPNALPTKDHIEVEKRCVRERARAYEHTLSERKGSPVTPKHAEKGTPKSAGKATLKIKETPESTSKNTPKNGNKENTPVQASTSVQETEMISIDSEDTDADIVNSTPPSRRSSAVRRKSKRVSTRVLGSKARMRSLQGRLSVTGPCVTSSVKSALCESLQQAEMAVRETSPVHAARDMLAVRETPPIQATDIEPCPEVDVTQPQQETIQAKEKEGENKGRSQRTRLRLNKSNKSATDSDSSIAEGSHAQDSNPDKSCHVPDSKDSRPTHTITRTKRKQQKSLSSDDDIPEPKMSKGSAGIKESDPRTRTRTKARHAESTASKSNEDLSVKPGYVVSHESTTSECLSTEGSTRTRTKARKLESKEPISSVDSVSSGGVDTEGTEGSVFESPPKRRSSVRLSDQLSAKSSTTTDSGIGTCSSSDVVKDTATSHSVPTSLGDEAAVHTDSLQHKAEDKSRLETQVISRSQPEAQEEDFGPCRSTRTKTRQEHNDGEDDVPVETQHPNNTCTKTRQEHNDREDDVPVETQHPNNTCTKTRQEHRNREVDVPVETEQQNEQPHMTRTKTRKRKAEEEATDTSQSKKSCTETPPKAETQTDDAVMKSDSDSEYEDIDPDPPQRKQRVVPSFLNQLRKSSLSRSTSLVSGVVTSFLKRNTPPRKPTFQHMQEQKKRELQQKEKREQERLSRLETTRKNRAEEQKRKREERMRKVAEMREMRQMKEHDLKKNLAEKLKERHYSTEKMKEDRFKEEREKQRQRLKRQLETDERRRQEEDQRLKKLLEQQEEQRRQEEMMQRKREQEELERLRRQAEERRRQEERVAEAERLRLAEIEKLRLQELERERQRQKEKEQKEKIAAQERAERVRQEQEKRKEREMKIQKELEKLKELEQQRLARVAAQEEEKRREEGQLQQSIQQHNRTLTTMSLNTTLTLNTNTSNTTANTTKTTTAHPAKTQPNPDSYSMTPVRQKKNGSMENYDINDLKSDDSTDDDENPRKKIPVWAQGANLKANLINQVYHPPDLDTIFSYIEPPDLNQMFDRKRARFNKRTSSAVWTSPLHKPH